MKANKILCRGLCLAALVSAALSGEAMAQDAGKTLGSSLGLIPSGSFKNVYVPDAAVPQAGANFEGVWLISKPQTTLTPVDGKVPFTKEGLAKYNENKKLKAQKNFDDYDIYTSRCSNPGVPRLMLTQKRFKIWQRQGVLNFKFEWNRANWYVDLRGADHGGLDYPSMTGDSIGKWEGSALTITTTDISERTLLDDLLPHSDALKVTQRVRLVDADTLEDRITIDDAKFYSKPWEAVLTYKRQPDDFFSQDEVCLAGRDMLKSVFTQH